MFSKFRINCLYELKNKLDLNYEILYDRAENITSLREKFDIVVSRAVTSLPILMELSIPYLKVNGVLISYKGKINESIDTALSKLNCTLLSSNNLFLQENDLERTFVIIKKEAETEIIYPRTYDKIKKNPL